MHRGEIWWAEFDERRPVVLLSEDEPAGFLAMQVVAPADPDIAGLGIEVTVGIQEGLPSKECCAWYSPARASPLHLADHLGRDDLIERTGTLSPKSSARSTTPSAPGNTGRNGPRRRRHAPQDQGFPGPSRPQQPQD